MADGDNSQKSEIILALNTFNKPAEATGAKAWAKLICNLIFMEPGVYPTDPEMGCDLGKYQFSFLDDVISEINDLITTQVHTYLPDIPISRISASKTTSERGEPILLVALEFSVDDSTNIAVVAAEKSESKLRYAIAV